MNEDHLPIYYTTKYRGNICDEVNLTLSVRTLLFDGNPTTKVIYIYIHYFCEL